MQIRAAIVVVAAFSAGMALVPMSAKAICQQEISADRAFSDGTMIQVLGRTDSTVASTPGAPGPDPTVFTFVYVAETTNPLFGNQIFAAVGGHNRLFIIGEATTCPTTGTFRDIGTIIQIYQQP
jgi:hypothetical protein